MYNPISTFGDNLKKFAAEAPKQYGASIAMIGGGLSKLLGTDLRVPGLSQGLGAYIAGQSQPFFTVKPAYAAEPTQDQNSSDTGTSQPLPAFSIAGPGVTTGNPTPDISGNTPTNKAYENQILGTSTTNGNGTVNLTSPAVDPNGVNPSNIDALNKAYANSRASIEAQGPILDSTYNTGKSDIEGALADAETTANNQKSENAYQYGQLLRQNAKNYRDLGIKTQGVYSGLNALDSSSYADTQNKNEQSQIEQTAQTQRDQEKRNSAIDTELNTYKRTALSSLATLANQYQSGKNAIADAIAKNDLSSAQAIQEELNRISSNATSIQNSLINFANQASLLKAQGLNVKTNIANNSANPFVTSANNFMSGYLNNANNFLSTDQPTQPGYYYQGKQITQDQWNQLHLAGLV